MKEQNMNSVRTTAFRSKEEYSAPKVHVISFSSENAILSGFPISDWEEE